MTAALWAVVLWAVAALLAFAAVAVAPRRLSPVVVLLAASGAAFLVLAVFAAASL